MALVAAALGSAFLFIRVLVDAGVEPFGVAAARTGVSLVVLTPVMYWKRATIPRDRRVILLIGGIGLINMTLPYTMIPLSEQRVSSGTAAILSSTMPMTTAVLAASMIADERFTLSRVLGLALGFVGVMALMGGEVGADSATDATLGILFLMTAIVGYATASVFIRRWHTSVPALPLAYIQFVSASCLTIPLALVTGAYTDASVGIEEWGSLLGVTVFGTAMAMLLFMWLVVETGPVRASVVTYLFPPIGVFLGWLLLDEPVGWTLLLSLVLIVSGVALVQATDVLKRFLPPALRSRATVVGRGD